MGYCAHVWGVGGFHLYPGLLHCSAAFRWWRFFFFCFFWFSPRRGNWAGLPRHMGHAPYVGPTSVKLINQSTLGIMFRYVDFKRNCAVRPIIYVSRYIYLEGLKGNFRLMSRWKWKEEGILAVQVDNQSISISEIRTIYARFLFCRDRRRVWVRDWEWFLDVVLYIPIPILHGPSVLMNIFVFWSSFIDIFFSG